MKEDYEIKWWKDWIEADTLERSDMVSKLPFVNDVLDLSRALKDHDEVARHSITMMLNGFFEDLETAMYTKFNNERGTTDETNL